MKFVHSGRSLLALAGAAVLQVGCGTEGVTFTPEEQHALEQLQFRAPPADPSNRFSEDARAAALGQKLFFDARFSGPLTVASDLGAVGERGKVACATCHDPAQGGADRRSIPANISVAAGHTGRNAPTVLNAAFQRWQFWDGRKDSLWSQALGPIESGVEHNFSRLEVVHLMASIPGYRKEYEALFGPFPEGLSDSARFPAAGKPGDAAFDGMAKADRDALNGAYANFGKAIAAYERKLVSGGSAFDRFLAGEKSALSAQAQQGAKLFAGKAGCVQCHTGANLTDDSFHNLGLAQEGASIPAKDVGRQKGAGQCKDDLFNRAGAFSDARDASHLEGSVGAAAVEGAFRTPSLRNVSLTAPYMHTGSLATLQDVVRFYNVGGHAAGYSGPRDEKMVKLDLTDAEVEALVAFLESLDSAPLPRALVQKPQLPAESL